MSKYEIEKIAECFLIDYKDTDDIEELKYFYCND